MANFPLRVVCEGMVQRASPMKDDKGNALSDSWVDVAYMGGSVGFRFPTVQVEKQKLSTGLMVVVELVAIKGKNGIYTKEVLSIKPAA